MKLVAIVELVKLIARTIRTAVTEGRDAASASRKKDARRDPVGQWNDTVADGVRGTGEAPRSNGTVDDEVGVPADSTGPATRLRGRSVAGTLGHDEAVDLLRESGTVPPVIFAPKAGLALEDAPEPPLRQSDGAAGYDLRTHEGVTLGPGEQKLVGTGWKMRPPEGYCAVIWPRSGLATKELDRRAGLIDQDYRGEIKVLLRNEGGDTKVYQPGERIAQLKLERLEALPVYLAEELPDVTTRGDGGFGSTGEA